MSRSRNIKPGFFSNDLLGALQPLARILFAGIWTVADREGRLEDRPARLKMQLLGYDNCDANALLQELADAGFIARYKAAGVAVIQVLAWAKHQNPHVKEAASSLPERGENCSRTVQAPDIPERAGLIPSLLIPDSLSLDSSPLIPDSSISAAPLPGKPVRKRTVKPQAPSGEAWDAYSSAYAQQYGCEPVRNASVNAQLALVVGKLGAEEAPLVAAFFVGHRNGLYVSAMHPVTLLLRDAEKLRTEWATGRQMTRTQGQQADRTQTNANAFAPLLAAAKESEHAQP